MRFGKTPKKKTNKFHAKKITYNSIEFDSELEGAFYMYLCSLEAKGLVRDIKCQIPMFLMASCPKLGKYTCDFQYFDVTKNKTVLLEIKSSQTFAESSFPLRMKLLALEGIEISVLVFHYDRNIYHTTSFLMFDGKLKKKIELDGFNDLRRKLKEEKAELKFF